MSDQKLTLTHLNIRQSIVIMLARLILVDLLLAVIVIGTYFLIVQAEVVVQDISRNPILFLFTFIVLGVIKIALSIQVVLSWLNEYYEITPGAVYHKRGIIFRKTENYELSKVRAVSIRDTFLGEMCNFATVTLYDLRLNKYLDMYLIHNPDRYVRILRMLRPNLELKADRVRLPGVRKRDLGKDYDENQP